MKPSPYIPANQTLPELTFKSLLLGFLLSMVMAGANAYLGLFAGLTVSAAIPASVISMGILRMFKKHNILENNAVSTAASSGEALAAGVIFTLPALILMGKWTEFSYFETTTIALTGGLLGVLFTIPLRYALIVKQNLTFPEGLATAEVLKTGETGGRAVKFLAYTALAGAATKLGSSAFNLWTSVLDKAVLLGNRVYLYFGMDLSPALMAVGYIVGLNIAVLVFMGGAFSWWVAIPAYIAINGAPPDMSAVDMGYFIWSKKIRYIGVGAMVVGGLWALVNLRGAIVEAFKHGARAMKDAKGTNVVLRTEKDIPFNWVIALIAAMIAPVFLIYETQIQNVPVSLIMCIIMVFAGFLFSAVAGYMAGVVGSSNNPISGVTIATILFSSIVLLILLGKDNPQGPMAAIMIGGVVCCAAAMAGDNMQDMKSGHLLGATPWKQQITQFVGVLGGGLVIAPVLNLLNTAYGFGPKTDLHPQALAAPQSTLMQSVAQGVFGDTLPKEMVFIGAAIGILIIVIDQILAKRGSEFRMPILAIAVGIYLPFELASAILLGGLVAHFLSKKHQNGSAAQKQRSERMGIIMASGLITGEALIGIAIAVPIAVSGKSDILYLLAEPVGGWPGVIITLLFAAWIYKSCRKTFETGE